jgi:hypothetical protein
MRASSGLFGVTSSDLVTIAFVEAFDKRILVGLSGLDVTDLDAVLLAPVNEGRDTELRAIVHMEPC